MQAANTTAEAAAVTRVNQDWNPDDDEFVQEVVVAGIALFTVGVAVLAAFLIYYVVRCVCWICLGDVRPHPSS
jgi:preprotein translocase subunit Sss1